ncbi:MAG TPA: hypothetical protein VMV80_06625 [Anaerolineales bacterium]|nr:hypothetical protein [Anaerolineales bacterium]
MTSPDVTNRETMRDALYTLLSTGLVGSGKWVQGMYAYQPDAEEIDGKSPLMWVSSGPTARVKRTINLRTKTSYTFLVQSAVRLDKTKTPAWVEDRLDKIEKELMDILLDDDNRSTATWQNMDVEESTPGYTVIGGNEYRIEIFPVIVEAYDG